MESLSSCFCTGNEIPVATANTHSSTTVPKEPSGTMKPRHNAIVMVSPNTAPTGPNARRTRCGRAAPRASKIVIAASTAPNQFTERDFDSRIGWNRLTWQIRTSVNIATPCTISNARQRDQDEVDEEAGVVPGEHRHQVRQHENTGAGGKGRPVVEPVGEHPGRDFQQAEHDVVDALDAEDLAVAQPDGLLVGVEDRHPQQQPEEELEAVGQPHGALDGGFRGQAKAQHFLVS